METPPTSPLAHFTPKRTDEDIDENKAEKSDDEQKNVDDSDKTEQLESDDSNSSGEEEEGNEDDSSDELIPASQIPASQKNSKSSTCTLKKEYYLRSRTNLNTV